MIIKNFRKQLGLGQLEFALVLGVSRSEIAEFKTYTNTYHDGHIALRF